MATMLAAERRQALADRVRTRGRLEAAQVAAELGTSTETIRKDLIALESQGLLRRVHGGALQREPLTFEPDVASRTDNLAEKGRIAARAADEVPAAGAVVVDAGSTTLALAERMPLAAGLTVYTNALTVAGALATRGFAGCHTFGGRVRPTTLAEVGAPAQRALDELRFDVAFVGANAVSFGRGLCTPDPEEAAVKRAVVRAADRVVLLVDHAKFGRDSLVRYAGLEDVDLVVTGAETGEEHRRALREAGVEVVFA